MRLISLLRDDVTPIFVTAVLPETHPCYLMS